MSLTKDFVEHIREHDKIVIVGPPGGGKTTTANLLAGDHTVIHADEYIDEVEWSDFPDYVIDKSKVFPPRYILEGCGCYRILRNGLRDDSYAPDLVIEVAVTGRSREESMPDGFNHALAIAWQEFNQMNEKFKIPVMRL